MVAEDPDLDATPSEPDPMLDDYTTMVEQIAATQTDQHRTEWARPRKEHHDDT